MSYKDYCEYANYNCYCLNKGVEIAYEIRQEKGEMTNWLIFQLDMEHLDQEYGINT